MATRRYGSGADKASDVGSREPATAARDASTASTRRTSTDHGSVRTRLSSEEDGSARTRSESRPSASRRSIADPPVRDPEAYALTDHVLERIGQPGRYVTFEAVHEAIETGQLRWNTSDGWRFATVIDGIRYVIVVGDTETPSPVVVTGWTEIADREDADHAPGFDATDLETIRLRSDLSDAGDSQIPDRIGPRDVSRPFTVGDHHVHTAPGERSVVCTDCGGRFRSKSALRNRRCR
ncbi:hypothetical protein ACFQAS_04165 [Halopenitus salinus]|uniref:Halobacterial output domain-containing protein n=1 Tax=Halopenitus salinus TaxID=1198295 RepID=A0ABD5UQ32_9EURY